MRYFLLIALLVSVKTIWAQNSVNPKVAEAIRQIGQVREALKISASNSQSCEVPQVPSCTFENYCSRLAGKGQDFYLYQNKEGRQIPNYLMILNARFAETCLDTAFPQAAVADPFAFPEQLFDEKKAGGREKLKKNHEKYRTEVERSRRIFTEAKDRVLALLEKRRTLGNSKEIANMIQRIKVIQFAPVKLGDAFRLVERGCEMPNAYFLATSNEVTVCPQFMNLPDAALLSIISHELGHAIDPCHVTYSYSKGSKGKLELNLPTYMGNDESPKNAALPTMDPDQHPLKEVISCLKSPASLGVKLPSAKDLLRAVDKEEAALKAELSDYDGGEIGDATVADFEDQRNAIRKQYPLYQNCGDFTGNGHVQEAFSDWVATQVVSEKISEMQDASQSRQWAFESHSAFWSVRCDNVKQAVQQQLSKKVGPQCSNFENAKKAQNSEGEVKKMSHPPTANRFNRIVMAKPEIQKALGCKAATDAKECR